MSSQTIRAALYARVSSDQQAKAATIDSQVSQLQERIAEDGCQVEAEFCFLDDGVSGATLVRPALERLRDVAYAGAIDRLYVHSPDRLSRKYAYQVLLIDELKAAGVEVVFLNHTGAASPEEELLLQMQGVIAEYERAKIMERSRRGKRHAARRGSVSALGGAPYGYRYVTAQQAGGGARYEIVPEQAEVVRQVFQWVAVEGVPLRGVCRRLREQGVPTSTGKAEWVAPTIHQMLKNPAYVGRAAFGKTRREVRRKPASLHRGREGPAPSECIVATSPEEQETIPVPALVSEELFRAAAEKLAENRRHKRERASGASHLLQGLLRCACCGYSFHRRPAYRKGRLRSYAYYRCGGADGGRFAGAPVCDNGQVRTDCLEEVVWEDVAALLREPERIRQEYQRRLAGGKKQTSPSLVQLEADLRKVSRGIARLIDLYQDGLLSKEEFEPRLADLRDRQTHLRQHQQALAATAKQQDELRLVIAHLGEFQERIQAGLESLDAAAKREIIQALVKRVEIGKQEVRIVYKVSPPPFAHGPASRGANKVQQHCSRRDAAKNKNPQESCAP